MSKNTKISIFAIIIISILAIVAITDVVYGEKISTIELYAENNEKNIFVFIEDGSSIIVYQTQDGMSTHYDSKINLYNSGSFVLKSPETGIMVWGYSQGDNYKLSVMTLEGVDRFTTRSIMKEPVEQELDTIKSQDILKDYWENRNTSESARTDHTYIKPEKVFDPDTLDVIISNPNSVQYKHNFSFDVVAIDTEITSKKDQRIQDVTVIAKVTDPVGKLVKYWNGVTDKFGKFEAGFFIPDNTMLGAYTLEIVADLENYTTNTKLVNFYVIPLDDTGSTNRCADGFIYNPTSSLCYKTCEKDYVWNPKTILCEAK